MSALKTVGDYIRHLQQFPEDWPVHVATPAGGGVSIEHREIGGKPVVAVFGSNGGRFGENPLTEDEYNAKAEEFMRLKRLGYVYTSIHGDRRLYKQSGLPNETCYGHRFDRRIVERMIETGILSTGGIDIERVRYLSK
jgi:hypothetical protein